MTAAPRLLIVKVSSATFTELRLRLQEAGMVLPLALRTGAELLDLRGVAVVEDPDAERRARPTEVVRDGP